MSLDGTDVPGSPVALSMPAGDFSLDVVIPAGAAPGSSHVIVVRNVLSPDSVAFASLTVTVRAAALADTGTDPQLALGVGALLLAAGSALVLLRRRSTLRSQPR